MRLALAAALIAATPVTAQDDDPYGSDAPLPAEAEFMCALDKVTSIENGREIYAGDDYEDERRPSLVKIPKTGDEGLFFEGMSKNGDVYAYIKQQNEGMRRYIIHGTFDLKTADLVTTRSAIFPTNDGGLVTDASSFRFLCAER